MSSSGKVTNPSYRSLVVADAPVSYYRLGEASSASPAADEMGVNAGTYNGSPTMAAVGAIIGDPDTAVTFASGKYMRAKATKILSGQTNFTIEGWVKKTGASAEYMYVERPASGNEMLRVEIQDTVVRFSFRDTAGTLNQFTNVTTTLRINDGRWHHVVAVKAGTLVNVYVDGAVVLGGLLTATDTFSSANILCDVAQDPTGGAFAGTIDEIALYTTALAPARIQRHFLAGAGNS